MRASAARLFDRARIFEARPCHTYMPTDVWAGCVIGCVRLVCALADGTRGNAPASCLLGMLMGLLVCVLVCGTITW